MTAPDRVSEDLAQRAIEGLGYTHLLTGDPNETVQALTHESCVRAAGVIRALLAERTALEAKLAEAEARANRVVLPGGTINRVTLPDGTTISIQP